MKPSPLLAGNNQLFSCTDALILLSLSSKMTVGAFFWVFLEDFLTENLEMSKIIIIFAPENAHFNCSIYKR